MNLSYSEIGGPVLTPNFDKSHVIWRSLAIDIRAQESPAARRIKRVLKNGDRQVSDGVCTFRAFQEGFKLRWTRVRTYIREMLLICMWPDWLNGRSIRKLIRINKLKQGSLRVTRRKICMPCEFCTRLIKGHIILETWQDWICGAIRKIGGHGNTQPGSRWCVRWGASQSFSRRIGRKLN